MKKNDICKLTMKSIKNYISNPDCLKAHRAPNRFVRNRKLSMDSIIQYLFYSSKASIYQNIVSIQFDIPDFFFPNISKQSLSKARQGIRPALFKELYYLSVDLFYKNLDFRNTWHGYHVFAIKR